MPYRVLVTETAQRQLQRITDTRIREHIAKHLDWLCEDPLAIGGKPLVGPLAGYYRIRAGGDRYRLLYTVDQEAVIVLLVLVSIRKEGDRKDIYALARRLLEAGLLEIGIGWLFR